MNTAHRTTEGSAIECKAISPIAQQLPRFEGHCMVLVQSPLQYLNALEFCHDAGIDTRGSILIVLAKEANHDRTYDQIFAMVEKSCWARVYTVAPLTPDSLLPRSFPLKLKREVVATRAFVASIQAIWADCGNVGLLVVGDYRGREMRHICGLYQRCSVVLLDDGSATHQIMSMRNGASVSPTMKISNGPKTWRLRWLGGLKNHLPQKVYYFTIYCDRPPEQDEVLQHNYPYWQDELEAYEANGETWFIGMSHVETGITSHEQYMRILERVIRQFGSPITYVPHRREKVAKLEAIKALGYQIKVLPTILEWELIHRAMGPNRFISVASSAFDTLPLILPEWVRFVVVNPANDYCSEKMQLHFNAILQGHHNNPRVEVVVLGD